MSKYFQFSIFNIRHSARRGFTIVELLVSLAIFAVLTGVVLARYRTFDSNAKYANAVEDVVLALRQAQIYGVGSKGNTVGCGTPIPSSFECSYGVHLSSLASEKNKIISFVDINGDHVLSAGEELPNGTITWPSNIELAGFTSGAVMAPIKFDITFKRPNPEAVMYVVGVLDPTNPVVETSGRVYFQVNDTKTGKVTWVRVFQSGQISIISP